MSLALARELMVGMMGFLICKVAVILSTLIKPMAIGLKENNKCYRLDFSSV